MTIVNHTSWRTDQLRAIVLRVAADEFGGAQWLMKRRALVVTFRYARRGSRVSGRAVIGGHSSTIFLPRAGAPCKATLAHTIAHEFAHNRGLHHKDMRGAALYMNVGDWRERYAWAADLPLERREAAARATAAEKAEAKLRHAGAMVKNWEGIAKRATTRLRHWRKQLRYHERRLAAMARPAAGG